MTITMGDIGHFDMTATSCRPHEEGTPSREVTAYRDVVDRLARDQHLGNDGAERLFEEMVRFLHQAAYAEQPVAPSAAVDHAWHAFILHTRDYADYCQRRFGRFIHHRPEPVSAAPPVQPVSGVEGDTGADCKAEEASCESEGNCTADCTADDDAGDNEPSRSQSAATPTGAGVAT